MSKPDYEYEVDRLFDDFMEKIFGMYADFDDPEVVEGVSRYLGDFDLRDAFDDGMEDYLL